MPRANRLGISIAASVVLHALALGLMLRERPPLRPSLVTIPVALVGRPGGGPGAAGEPAAAPAPPTAAPATPVASPPAPRRAVASAAPRRVARTAPATPAEPADPVPGTGGGGAAPSGGAGGEGDPGDGSGGARVAYGTNPLPPYPLVARRLGKEGVVVLEVRVAPDGHAAEVRVLRSSGFAPLDESAVTTVRDRWRFIPARRGGEAVESRVTVPIRFRLEDVAS